MPGTLYLMKLLNYMNKMTIEFRQKIFNPWQRLYCSPHIPVFILFALIVGVVFINSKGPFTGPDMYGAHYKAALAVATGQGLSHEPDGNLRVIKGNEDFFKSGGQECTDVTIVATQLINPLNSDDKDLCIRQHDEKLTSAQVATKAIIAYPPLGYLPQALGLFVAMNGDMEPIAGQTLARLINLFVYIILISLSIRLIPVGKWLFVALGLLPTSLFLASSLSPDSLNIAWSFLFVGFIVRLMHVEKKVGKRDMGIIAFLGVGLFMLKVAYAPLLLLVLGLPNRVMRPKVRWILFAVIATVGASAYLLWSAYYGSIVSSVDIGANADNIRGNLIAALSGILINILFTPYRIFETNQTIYVFLAVALCWMIITRIKGTKLVKAASTLELYEQYKIQFFAILAAVVSLGVTYSALLLTWTDVTEYGFIDIQGFQGRYTLPILPLLILFYYLPQARGRSKLSKILRAPKAK